jgi:hypothetical protein
MNIDSDEGRSLAPLEKTRGFGDDAFIEGSGV